MPLWPCLTKRRAEEASVGLDELIIGLPELRRPRLAVQAVEQRLGIERLQMARAAGHEEEDDGLGLGGATGRAGFERIGADAFVVQHGRERKAADAATGGLEEGTAGGHLMAGAHFRNTS